MSWAQVIRLVWKMLLPTKAILLLKTEHFSQQKLVKRCLLCILKLWHYSSCRGGKGDPLCRRSVEHQERQWWLLRRTRSMQHRFTGYKWVSTECKTVRRSTTSRAKFHSETAGKTSPHCLRAGLTGLCPSNTSCTFLLRTSTVFPLSGQWLS